MKSAESQHLTSEAFQLLADGELTPSQRASFMAHIDGCWICRGKLASHEALLSDLALARCRQWEHSLPPASHMRAALIARLRERSHVPARRRAHKPTGDRFVQKNDWQSFLQMPFWTPVTAVTVCFVLLIVFVLTPPRLSAETLLCRAEAAQTQVQYVELSIHVNGREYREKRYRKGGHWRSAALMKADLPATPVVDWANPLDAASFRSWRAHLAHPVDEIRREGTTLRLTTWDSSYGGNNYAAIVVRSNDFWPVAKRISLSDGKVIEIAEMSESMIIPPALIKAQPKEIARPSLPIAKEISAAADSTGTHPTAAGLAEAELAARLALHRLGADQGEEITITEEPSEVRVTGRVEAVERKNEIAAALHAIPWLHADLQTFQESVKSSIPMADSTKQPSPAAPAFSEWMARQFPDPSARTRFADTILAAAESAAEGSSELEKIASRYDERTMDLLSPSSREVVFALAGQYERQVSQAVAEMQSQAAPLVTLGPAEIGSSKDWRAASIAAARLSRQLQQTVMASFSGGDAANPLSAESAAKLLSAQLAGIAEEIDRLRKALRTGDIARSGTIRKELQ